MKTDDAIAQARELLAAVEQQLTAASAAETAEARDRVAALAFGLTALLDSLGSCRTDNDQEGAPVSQRPVVEFHEQFAGGRDRRLIVAQFAARWFVLSGYVTAPLATYGVHGPYDHQRDARGDALRLHNEATGMALWPMQRVVEA